MATNPPRAPVNAIGAPLVELTSATGGTPTVVPVSGGTPLGYQQITSLASSTALAVPTGATVAQISVEAAGVRYRDDGTAPTASIGMPLLAGANFTYGGNLASLRFIAISGSPVLNVSYYK